MGMSCNLKTIPIDIVRMNDNIVTTGDNFVFTRYLYEKDEVKLTLLISLLNKTEDAIFWAYELYYSGFISELIDHLWKIYYDFYATLNPKFEKYLATLLGHDLNLNSNAKENEKLIYMAINDFIIRPCNIDIFILDQIRKTDIEKDYLDPLANFKKQFTEWLESHDYINIALYVLEDCEEADLDDVIETYVEYFSYYFTNMDKNKITSNIKKTQIKNRQNKRKMILSRIMACYSFLNELKMGKNTRVQAENEDVEIYKTQITQIPLSPYKILPNTCKYSIDSTNHLSLFHLKRDTQDIKTAYLDNWLYFASFSPIWKERISAYGGSINHEKKAIIFDDEEVERFYDNFGYEPDEQKIEVQNKSIQVIENVRTWKSFYQAHNKNCLIDIDIDSSYLTDLRKIHY
jgi:hypothetical protein